MESNHPVLPGSADRRSSEGMDFMHAATENTGHLLFIFLYDSLVPIRQKFNGAARGYFHLLSHLDGDTHPAVVILHFVLSLCLLGWHLCSQEVGTLTISGTFSRSSTTYHLLWKDLIQVVSQCLPYIGYPRILNAVACVNKAAENWSEAPSWLSLARASAAKR